MNYERKGNVVTMINDNGEKLIISWDELIELFKVIWKKEKNEWDDNNEKMV